MRVFFCMQDVLLSQVDALLHARSDRELTQLLRCHDAHAIADVIDHLDHGRRKCFALLPPEIQARVYPFLSEASCDAIFHRLSDTVIARVLHFLHEDTATDLLQRLPERRHGRVLRHVHDNDRRHRIEKLLTFDPHTAGGLMDLNFMEVSPHDLLPTVLKAISAYTKEHGHAPVVFVRDTNGIRWISGRKMLSASPESTAIALGKPIPVIPASTDREDVLSVIDEERGDLACVTDDHGKIIGVIHVNDLLSVAEAEASEDAYLMGAVGVLRTGYLETRFLTIWRKRIGWLLVLFIAELLTFSVLSRYESTIASVTALALFLPLCISTGGNSGSQAATLITRAMALGDLGPRQWFRVLWRELLMGIALGIALGLVAFFRVLVTPHSILGHVSGFTLALVIAQTVALICLWGTLVGSMLPLLFKRFGFDPAYASSPFVATFVDVTGILIYFTIANMLFL